MYVIGLTGGIASGKSTVSKMLSRLGAYIVDADKLARECTLPGKPAWQAIIQAFGQDMVQANGELDRKRLGELVFTDKQARTILEKITHPQIAAAAQAAITAATADGFNVIVLDAPLLIEAGWHTMVDAVWVVYVDEQTQLARLQLRDNCSRKAAQVRINAQLPLADKLKYADVVIDNSTTLAATETSVHQAWRKIPVMFPETAT